MKPTEEERFTDFGNNVRKVRIQKNLTQQQLATDLRIHKDYLGKIERGKTNFSIAVMMKIAKCLDVDLSDLFIK